MTRKPRPLQVIAGSSYRPLFIADMELPCYVLENETRVFSLREMFFAMASFGGKVAEKIPALLSSNAVTPFIPKRLSLILDFPVQFKNPAGRGKVYGYPAATIVDISRVIVDAYENGALGEEYGQIARRCSILLGSVSKLGIIAMVDEVTGYQDIRRSRALAEILDKYLSPEWQPWAKQFPDIFYREMFRLNSWNGPEDLKRPSVIARYIDDLVFRRLDRSVLEDLGRKTSKRSPRARRSERHPWLTYHIGHPRLRDHLLQVMALMKGSPNWKTFHRMLERAFPVEP